MTERQKLTLKKTEPNPQPAVKPKQPPPKKITYTDVIKTVHWICKQYPEIFNYKEPSKPLKVKILHDLAKAHPEQSKKQLGRALNAYTSTFQYYELVMKSEYRYDLAGNINGSVTESAKTYSKQALEQKLAKKQARQLAKQQKAIQQSAEQHEASHE